MNFTPLHVYSGYSFQKSGLQIEQYCSLAKKLGYFSLAVTDYETFSGQPVFVHEAKKQGLKPIVGADFVVDNLLTTFIVKDETGYQNLLKYSLLAQKNELSFNKIKEDNGGLFIIVSNENIALKKAYIENKDTFARKLARVSRGIEDFYIGLDNSDLSFLKEMRDFAFSHGYNVVAFPHIKYLKKEDAIILKMVETIETKEVLSVKKLDGEKYLPSLEELQKIYKEEEIEATNKIADNANFELIKPRGRLLKFDCKDNLTSEQYLRKLAFDGLKRLHHEGEEYVKRLNYELAVINKMGFNDYFLIVQDYVNFARNNDIAVGPGRGSASGSLVAHCLGITVPDPLKYDLLFERFLNPSRQTMPDIDVDFSDVGREKIVEYIRHKYGDQRVAKITAIQKIGAKQAFHDVGRIFDYNKHDIELFTNIIKDEKFDKLSLREIYKKSKEFRELVNDDKYYLEIVTLASKIESLPRQASLHAVGIVLNADSLEERIPVTVDSDGSYIEQFEKDYIEEQGFLKMDILAIRNLTIIDDCLARLKQKGIILNRDEIPYEDKDAIRLIREGKTIGIFQLDTVAFRIALKTFKPDNFEDIVALLALNRPGPQANIPVYARRKDGKEKVTYLHPSLKDILSLTYGVLVYQEQVMQVASKMAGFSLAEADILRRAISKKDSTKLVALKEAFIKGSIKNGYKEADALKVYDAIYKFGDYGFNRSHSVVYAIFSCRMAYLKAHYPEEFYAAILSNASADEFNNTIAEMKEANIKVASPDINESDLTYKLVGKEIIFPLNAIKGISINSAISIIKERQNKPFEDLFDFVLRTAKYKISSQQVINLIDAGAFDKIEPSRNSLRNNVVAAFSFADIFATDGSDSFLTPGMFAKPTFNRIEDNKLDNLNREFNVLGLMVSGSPLGIIKDKIEKLCAIPINKIPSSKGNIKVVAILKSFKKIKNKLGKDMAFLTIYDDTGEIEVTLFEEAIKNSSSMKRNKIILLNGYYNYRRGEFSIEKFTNLEDLKDE